MRIRKSIFAVVLSLSFLFFAIYIYATTWSQTSSADFSAGTFVNTTVSNGNVVLANTTDINASTVLLLHMNGADSSTTFTDSSLSNKAVTANGNAQIDTAQSKFGGASGLFDGTGDFLNVSDSDDWNFGTGDFTIEFWSYSNSYANNELIVARVHSLSPYEGWYIQQLASGKIRFVTTNNSYSCNTDGAVSTGTWHHIALIGSSGTIRFYVDGVAQTNYLTSIQNYATTLWIGAAQYGGNPFNGSLDEFRISKGIARWTSNFTPPTDEYGYGYYPSGKFESQIYDAGATQNWQTLSWNGTTQSGIDAETKLMLHADGADTSTSFIDSELTPKTVTATGNAQIDTAQSKFGGASALFDGTGDYLNVSDSDDWNFGTGNFTIDTWVRFNTIKVGDNAIISQQTNGTNFMQFYLWNNAGNNYWTILGYDKEITILLQPLSSVATNTWYHIAFVRSGNTFYIFQNGTLVGSTTDASGFQDYTGKLTLGRNIGTDDFDGWIDELRITKGIARWTANFTPPTTAYEYKTQICGQVAVNDTGSWVYSGLSCTPPVNISAMPNSRFIKANFTLNTTNTANTPTLSDFNITYTTDTAPRYYNNTTSPSSLTYSTSNQDVTFNISWIDAETSVNQSLIEWLGANYTISNATTNASSYYSRTFAINNSAGVYGYRFYAQDTGGLWNSTINYSYVIAKASRTADVIFSESSPQIFEVPLTVDCSADVGGTDGSWTLYSNGTTITKAVSTVYGAGGHNFTCVLSEGANYTVATKEEYFTVTKKSANNLAHPATQTIAYGDSVLQYYTTQATIAVPKLYRNHVEITNGTSVVLGAGTYTYTANQTDTANYTLTSDTETLTVNQAPTSIITLFNGTAGDRTYNNNTIANITAVLNTSGTVNLNTNMTGWVIQSSASPLINYTLLLTTSQSVYYSVVANYTGNANYSASSQTNYILVTAGYPPRWFNNVTSLPTPQNYPASVQFNFTCEDPDGSCTGANMTVNGTTYPMLNTSQNYTLTLTLPAGNHQFYYTLYDNGGLTNTSDTFAYVIDKASNPVTLYLRNATNEYLNQNMTVAFSASTTNATATIAVGSVNIYRDSIAVSNPNIISLGAGIYSYKVNGTGNANYSDNSTGITHYLEVRTATPSLSHTSNSPVTYPWETTSSCSASVGTAEHYLNDTCISPNYFGLLGAGSYSIICNVSATANYSSASNTITHLVYPNYTGGASATTVTTTTVNSGSTPQEIWEFPNRNLTWENITGIEITNNTYNSTAILNYSDIYNSSYNYSNILNTTNYVSNLTLNFTQDSEALNQLVAENTTASMMYVGLILLIAGCSCLYLGQSRNAVGWTVISAVLFITSIVYSMSIQFANASANWILIGISLILTTVSILFAVYQAFDFFRKKPSKPAGI